MRRGHFPLVPQDPGRRISAGYYNIAREILWSELVNLGRQIGGPDKSEVEAYSLAVSGNCHCGACKTYAHCSYRSPLHLGDVLHNVFGTSWKSGGLVARASARFGNHSESDVVIDLGMGAGSCTSGWDLERGSSPIGMRMGVEIENHSIRLAKLVHPEIHVANHISQLDIPSDGHLIVLSGLVFNEVGYDVAKTWAEAITTARDEFTWVDVSYQPSRSSRPDQLLESLGYEKEVFFSDDVSSFSGWGWHQCEAMTWRR